MNTLVVIDDSEPDRYLARRAAKKTGLELCFIEYECAYDAVEDFMEAERFRARFGEGSVLVLLDINMPSMSGFEFLEALEARSNLKADAFRVVVFTSSEDPSEEARASNNRWVTDFASKPIEAEQIALLATADID